MNTTKMDLNKLYPFAGHPYKVHDNEEMDALVESIRMNGILTPLIVRPLENGEYEVVSGHRRLYAARKAGLETVPAIIMPMSRDEAAVAVVDSNLHREHLLPSEKAFAYKLKMEALNHQGVTSGQVGQKWSRDVISDADSGRQVQRYIRLTHLIPSILSMVDEGRIAFTPAVELSYFEKERRPGNLHQGKHFRRPGGNHSGIHAGGVCGVLLCGARSENPQRAARKRYEMQEQRRQHTAGLLCG